MPNICWCGNHNLEKYSDTYSTCTICNTLVSNFDIDDNIYQVNNEEEDLYGKNYWIEDMTKRANVNDIDQMVDLYLKERAIYWLKFTMKYRLPEAKVVEIGCGLGQFSYLLKSIGYEQIAFELSNEICIFIRENLGINIQDNEFTSETIKNDIIIAMDVIEHILEPKKIMKEITTGIKDSGILILQLPCYDQTLTYEEMLNKKVRFKNLLQPEQHVYLYSKDSISKLLNEYGFNYINFEPPIFGEDYDMFIFASKQPFIVNTPQQVNDFLNKQPNGRLVKAMIDLYSQQKNLESLLEESEQDRAARLEKIGTLGKQLEESEQDRTARLGTIEALGKQLEESEQDRTARLETIETLGKQLEESEQDRTARLETIETLGKQLEESERDRTARLEIVENLGKQLEESEQDRAARLEIIEILSKQLEESERDSLKNLGELEEVTRRLQKGQEDKEEILKIVERLSKRVSKKLIEILNEG
jgi:2-polyprenyl-3-methyl-5-hydroxy-6-metoxy-1,4-benzoquinol methylase